MYSQNQFSLPGDKDSKEEWQWLLPTLGGLIWEGVTQVVPFQPQLFELQAFDILPLPS